jgi:hypothetical protein
MAALKLAVERDPDSVPLGLHLASLLAPTEPAAALEHHAAVLAREPASPQAGVSLSLVALLLIVSSFAWPSGRRLAGKLRRGS